MEKNRISTGGDPRAFTEFGQLRDEISKLTHPARPDVDWQKVEQLSLALFRHNGVELQTLAWYTVARIRSAGLAGLAESAELLEALLTHHWSVIWPQQTHARVEILAWLSARLQQELRTLTLSYADLSMVYRVEQSLKHVCEVLQRLELKTLSKLDAVVTWMHNAALRLEKSEADSGSTAVMIPASGTTNHAETSLPQLVFVVNEASSPDQSSAAEFATQSVHRPRRMWLGFAIGVMATAVVSTGTFLGISPMWADRFELVQPLPRGLTPEQLSTLKHSSDLKEKKQELIAATQGQLDVLHRLSPLWSREYAASLAQQLVTLWPEESQTTVFASGLQKQLNTEALPESALQNWHHAQQGLEALTAQLNSLDERKGKYLTGSELKSAIFTIRRQLDLSPPTEELLRQIDEELKKQGSVSPALYQQLDMRINQLLNRYALLKQSSVRRE
ncbi:VasL domain-containing protein [Citrobacter portucalensis]|uniref:VasL domain-containing protein n=1 Tax=Citrobacter portucalensis TaxID=1639133 RepID=UPI0011ECCD9C|nr:VasL domain-containing protein [Citrobacter portucalensis]KAA0569843.1 ImpA domain-containing protein [Citrobacter portucalensis]MEB0981965.1 VasL domain-containing protein [Citrobacter portucalensis]WII77442.1 type VI secretion system ImpA family N-terminal domain-containing protein [Citrobacter portucalensis]